MTERVTWKLTPFMAEVCPMRVNATPRIDVNCGSPTGVQSSNTSRTAFGMPASERSQRTVCAWAAEPRIAITPSNGNARTRGRDERDTGCRRASARQNRKRKSERARRIELPILRGLLRGLHFALHQLYELCDH